MNIAAVTMVWNDDWFLRRWIGYYGPILGEDNLYVVSHGHNPGLADVVGNANVIDVPRDPGDVHFDKRRWSFLSAYASALTHYHDAVICLDVDELLVPTRQGLSLTQAFEQMEGGTTRCVPGFELFPRRSAGERVDRAERIAPHMQGAQFSPFYSKSGIIFQPVEFFPGAHGMIGEKPELTTDLALLHLRFVNLKELVRRNAARRDIAGNATADREEYHTEGRPFATWRRADKRTRHAFRSFQRTHEVGWDEMIGSAGDELERLRIRRGEVHKFLNRKYQPLRASLPQWMASVF